MNTLPYTDLEIKTYLDSLVTDETVIETGESAMYGRIGITYESDSCGSMAALYQESKLMKRSRKLMPNLVKGLDIIVKHCILKLSFFEFLS